MDWYIAETIDWFDCLAELLDLVLQFSRTVAPETSKGPALIAFMKHHKWTKAVMLTSTAGVWFQSGLELTKQLQTARIEVSKPAAFEPGSFKAAMLREVKRSGIRIIIVLAFDDDTLKAASSAAQEGMDIAGFAWIILEERVAVLQMQGWLHIRPFLSVDEMGEFREKVQEYSMSRFGLNSSVVDLPYSAALYDAIMLYAHAATKVLSKGGDLRDGKTMTAAFRDTSFMGIGHNIVALDEQGDRIESYEVMNYVLGADDELISVPIGVYNSTLKQYAAYERAAVWPGGTLEVPTDFVAGVLCQ